MQTAAGRLFYEMPSNPRRKRWGGYVCSGTVVSDGATGRSVILTASHCVYDDANKAFARNVLFIPNQAGTNPHDAAHASPLIDGDFIYVNTSNGVDSSGKPKPKAPWTNAANILTATKRISFCTYLTTRIDSIFAAHTACQASTGTGVSRISPGEAFSYFAGIVFASCTRG